MNAEQTAKLQDLKESIETIDVKLDYYPMFLWIYFNSYVDSLTNQQRNDFWKTAGEVRATVMAEPDA